MASEKSFKKKFINNKTISSNPSENIIKAENMKTLNCELCSSDDIIETKEGYVCRSCGGVLEIQKMVYHRPYNVEKIQHARLGTTQIGSPRERIQNSKSAHLLKLNKLQSIQSNEKAIIDETKIEISRIFNALNLPLTLKDLVFKKFQKIRAALKPGTKYRSPEKLVPITIYFILKFRNVSVNESDLLEVSKISKKDFNSFKLQIINYFPQYKDRDRKKYILQKIFELSEHFQLGMAFYYQCKKILYRLWDIIKNTKDDVITGLVASISVLCSFNEKVSVSSLCDKIGIKMSTIQSQVKKRIFEQFKVTGFTTLIKSSDRLKKIMEEMDLIEPDINEEIKNKNKVNDSEIIKIKLRNNEEIFEHFDDRYLYEHALNTKKNQNALTCFKAFSQDSQHDLKNNLREILKSSQIDLELSNYGLSKE
jgi:hypothetical protein